MAAAEGQVGQGAGQPANKGITKEEARSLFEDFISNRQIDPNTGGATLMADNAVLRERNRRLVDDNEVLRAQAPAAGSVVLSTEDAKLFNELKGLLDGDRKPADVAKVLKEHPGLLEKVAKLERDGLVAGIAEAEGWKPATLQRLTPGMDLVLEEVEEETEDEDGKKEKVKAQRGFAVTRDDKGNVSSRKRLSDELKDFIPSLSKEQGESSQQGDNSAAAGGQGTPFVRQSKGSKVSSNKPNLSKDLIGKRYSNPLGKKDEK